MCVIDYRNNRNEQTPNDIRHIQLNEFPIQFTDFFLSLF